MDQNTKIELHYRGGDVGGNNLLRISEETGETKSAVNLFQSFASASLHAIYRVEHVGRAHLQPVVNRPKKINVFVSNSSSLLSVLHYTHYSITDRHPMAPASPSQTTDNPAGVSAKPVNTQKQRKRRKVSRTRAGCKTCKARRKRCDMVRPRCGDCTRLSLVCLLVMGWDSCLLPLRNVNGLR